MNYNSILSKEQNNITEDEKINRKIGNPTESSRQQLQELLTCHICFCNASNPMMCPFCSKLYCEACIKKCLHLKPECPHCRKQIKGLSTMASCNRFVKELVSIVNDLIEYKVQEQICKEHEVQINYYCANCEEPVCCECQMFGTHQGHSLKKINPIYQAKYDLLRQMLTQFKTKIKEKQLHLRQMQNDLNQAKKMKEKQLKQIQEYAQNYRAKIIQQSMVETNNVQSSIQFYNESLVELDKVEVELLQNVEEAKESGNFSLQENIVNKINEIVLKEPPVNKQSEKNIMQQIIPPFIESRFTVTNYTKKKKEKSPIFSPVKHYEGLEWRLKVYPNGNETVQGQYLSVFIEMVNIIHPKTLYEFQIVLVNKKNPNSPFIRDHQSQFQQGQSWGYNKYIRLQNLIREGYLDPIGDQLQFHYFIRSPFYSDIYEQKELYLEHLNNEIIKQQEEMKELQELQNKIQPI